MISLSFQSIAQWPKSGEEIDFVTVPLGRWITPEQVSSLPSRPHKAHFISARYQADSNGPARPYEHQDDITCHMIVKDDESDSGPGSLREFARPLSFKFADGEVNFEDPVGPWYLAGISISSFGCI
ncbi:hypothetical protein MMC19_001343 [Ptychographa xylographoides]|nr:hypothetical protein [Ptychographa xylographoides]